MVATITPIECSNGEYWLSVNLDGHEMRRHGPFADRHTARHMAAKLAAVCRSLSRGGWV